MRFRIKTLLVVIALLAAYLAFARPFLRIPFGLGPAVLVWVTVLVVLPIPLAFLLAAIHEAYFEPKRPAQRPTAEDRSPD